MFRTNLMLAALLLAANVASAQEAAPPPAAAESETQQFARDRLMEMARFLGRAEKFSVSLRTAYDVVQENGQKIEFGEVRELAVQRPDRVRILDSAGDGKGDMTLFDGKSITILDGATAMYAQAPQPGDIDESVVYFVRDLQLRLPLAPLLMKNLADELQRRVSSVDYVEWTDVLGKPAHHIAARTARTDFQVWIAEGKRPLPLRIVMSYPAEEGQPQFRADFSQWNLSPRFDKATFRFTPPADARQIVFVVQLQPMEASSVQSDGAGDKGARP